MEAYPVSCLYQIRFHSRFLADAVLLEKHACAGSSRPSATVPGLFTTVRVRGDNVTCLRDALGDTVVWRAARAQGAEEELVREFVGESVAFFKICPRKMLYFVSLKRFSSMKQGVFSRPPTARRPAYRTPRRALPGYGSQPAVSAALRGARERKPAGAPGARPGPARGEVVFKTYISDISSSPFRLGARYVSET